MESCIALENPVRLYDATIESVILEELGFEYLKIPWKNSDINRNTGGVLAYSYSYGRKSFRETERSRDNIQLRQIVSSKTV